MSNNKDLISELRQYFPVDTSEDDMIGLFLIFWHYFISKPCIKTM